MTGSSGPDDGAQVDVEAAWAQIVMHWDDDDGRAEGPDGPGEGTSAPVLPGSDAGPQLLPPVPSVLPAQPVPPVDGERPRPAPAGPSEPQRAADAPAVPARSGASVWRGPTRPPGAPDDGPLDSEGYVPDEPPPLPRGDLVSWLSWGGVLGAPVFLLVAALFWRTAPSLLVAAAVTAFVVGFGTLVVRLPDRREDDGDDGAVV